MFHISEPMHIFYIVFFTALSSQIFKFITYGIKHRSWSAESFSTTGGMPSSHSALVTSLTTCVGIYSGTNTVLFIVSLAFTIVTVHDAFGIRHQAGIHAKILNKIIKNVDESILSEDEKIFLKEKLGHTPLEVLVGVILGIATAFIGSTFL